MALARATGRIGRRGGGDDGSCRGGGRSTVSRAGSNPGKEDAQDGKGALLAWDPIENRRRWTVPLDTLWNGGTLATAGGLVFQGTAGGYFCAYDASTGKRLWRFNAGLGIIAAPISYSAQGRQSISVLVGYGGATAPLPPTAPPDMSVKAVDDPSFQIDDADAQAGHALFNMISARVPGRRWRRASRRAKNQNL